MTAHDITTQGIAPPAAAPISTTDVGGILQSWRARRAACKRVRLLSARRRRMLARWLRRTASRSLDSDPLRRLNDPLLHYRAAAARTELLEIAAMVERAQNPDPACLVALHGLLANGCDSPLYNSRVPHSTLLEILRAAREGLAEDRERSNRVGTDSGGAARPERAA